jgi:hypothetical protein
MEVAPGEYVALPDGLYELAALLSGVMDTGPNTTPLYNHGIEGRLSVDPVDCLAGAGTENLVAGLALINRG